MKLTEAQRRGIEERFAVLVDHTRDRLLYVLPPETVVAVVTDVEACRDEVLTLVERLEPLLDGVD